MFVKSLFTVLPLLAAFVCADVVPTSPDGSTVVRIGSTAEALWTKDSNGNWTDVTVKLMTGDNFNMVEVATLAENVDGTTQTSLEWTVPEVFPTSKIYFLQFSVDPMTTPQWTTRFTIAAADGSTTEPTNSTQPGGQAIPWGTGMLVGGNSTTPISGGTSSNSTDETTSSSSTMMSSSTSSSSTMSSSSMMTTIRTSSTAQATPIASSASRSVSGAAAAASTSATSGAMSVQVAGGLVAFVGFVAGFMVI
ncbi:hypothetical protein NCC49_001401 [Naganishia albida]|nr:hypothetical protein NCC49_001401 [Naganishia albida]